MKFTADTITDAQIRELRAWYAALPNSITRRVGIEGCDLALGVAGVEYDIDCERLEDEDGNPREANENEIEDARARCAEILNQRGGTK